MAHGSCLGLQETPEYSIRSKNHDEIQKLLEHTKSWKRFIAYPQTNVCVVGVEDDFRISGCPYRIYSNIVDNKEFVYLQILKHQLSAFHKHHKCGSKVLMCTTAMLCESCLECINEGLNVKDLTEAFLRLPDFVRTVFHNISTPCHRPAAQKPRQMSLYSRHAVTLKSSSSDDAMVSDVTSLIAKLCHRAWLRQSLVEVVLILLRSDLRIEQWPLHVHTAVAKSSDTQVKTHLREGVLIHVDGEAAHAVRELNRRSVRVLLMTASLRSSFRHTGYEEKGRIVKVIADAEKLRENSEQECWRQSVLQSLKSIGADVVLMTGTCCPLLRLRLAQEKLLVLEKVPHSLVKSLSELHDVDAMEYAEDASCDDLIHDAVFDWDSLLDSDGTAFCSLSVAGREHKTLCFGHATLDQARISEEEFWHEFSRVQTSLQSGRMLPGSGRVEEKLAEELDKESVRLLAESPDDDAKMAAHVLFGSVSLGMRRFADDLKSMDRDEDEGADIHDAMEPRIASFDSAVYMIVTLLNIGASIVLKSSLRQ